MKKLAFISGVLFGSLSAIGFLFKIMHWPGANILLVLSIGLFSLVFVPSLAGLLYRRSAH